MSPYSQLMEEFLRLLQESPEFRAIVRSMLLSEELLALPDIVRALATAQQELAEHLRAFQESTERAIAAVAARQAETTAQIAALTDRMERVEQQIEALTQRMDRVEAQIEALTHRMERVEAQIEALTQRMDRVESQIEALTHRMERVEAQIEALTQRMEQVEAQVASLTEQMREVARQIEQLTARMHDFEIRLERVERDLGRLKGLVLPLVVERRFGGLFRKIVRRPRVLTSEELTRLVEDAEDAGLLSEVEAEQLLLADLVLEGRDATDSGQPIYVVCEISWGVGPTDVMRARQRAALLERIGQRPARPAVLGTRLTKEGEELLADMVFVAVPESFFD
ncbi:MAG: ATP-binding protein [Thermomicrobium sp.]|nr:ATP-binding protein [Thermomicrobium sp.]